MADLFTGTPISIAPTSPFLFLHDIGCFSGRFEHGGAGWVVGFKESTGEAVVGQTTDGGATWTVFTQIDHDGAGLGSGFLMGWDLDAARNEIRFVHRGFGADLVTFSFDLVGLTYSHIIDSGFGNFGGNACCVFPGGDTFAFFADSSGGTPRPIKYVRIVAGAFSGTPQPFASHANNLVIGDAIAQSGTAYVTYADASTDAILFNSVTSGGTVGSEVTAASSGGSNLGYTYIAPLMSRMIILNAFASPAQFLWSAMSDLASWTSVTLHSPSSTVFDNEIGCVEVGSDIQFYYAEQGDARHRSWKIIRVKWDGTTVGAKETYWDLFASPPPGVTISPTTDGISVDFDGSFIGVTVNATVDNSNNSSAFFTKITGPAPTVRGPRNRFY